MLIINPPHSRYVNGLCPLSPSSCVHSIKLTRLSDALIMTYNDIVGQVGMPHAAGDSFDYILPVILGSRPQLIW